MIGAAAVCLGLGIGAAIKLSQAHGSSGVASSISSSAVAYWVPGAARAPDFTLRDQSGKSFSLADYRGRPVIVAFIDPLCRDFCPREARILSQAVEQLGPRKPAIVAVSVDPWADTSKDFQQDAVHWKLAPGWRWAVGSRAQLAAVWRRYDIYVGMTRKTIAGITIHEVTSHTLAAYLIDGTGHKRALFLYPFSESEVVSAAHKVLGT